MDIVAPSDMMDGRIGAIRNALEESGASSTRASWPTAPSTPARSTARSATPWARPATWARATRRSTRWTRQRRRGAARGGAGHRRGRRHGDGQARHALPGHRAPGEGRVSCATFAYQVSGEYAMLEGRRRQRLARPRRGDDGVALLAFHARRRRRRADLLRARRRDADANLRAEHRGDARLPRRRQVSNSTACGPTLLLTGLMDRRRRREFEVGVAVLQSHLQAWTGGQLVDAVRLLSQQCLELRLRAPGTTC